MRQNCMAGQMQVSIGQKTATQEFLTLYVPVFHFYTPRKYQKTFVFLIFSGGIKMEHWDIKG